MRFNASIRRPSPIHSDWFKRARPKVGGKIDGVYFGITGKTYVAEDLSADQVEKIRNHPHVIVEIIAAVPDVLIEPDVAETPAEPVRSVSPTPDTQIAPIAPEPALEQTLTIPLKRGPGRPKKGM